MKGKQYQPTTRQTYHAVWRKFNEFVIKLDHIPQTWEERASLYCTFLIKRKNLQSQTIRSYLSAIKAKLKADDYKWDDNLLLFKSLTSAGKDNDIYQNRLPILSGLFQMINFELNRNVLS